MSQSALATGSLQSGLPTSRNAMTVELSTVQEGPGHITGSGNDESSQCYTKSCGCERQGFSQTKEFEHEPDMSQRQSPGRKVSTHTHRTTATSTAVVPGSSPQHKNATSIHARNLATIRRPIHTRDRVAEKRTPPHQRRDSGTHTHKATTAGCSRVVPQRGNNLLRQRVPNHDPAVLGAGGGVESVWAKLCAGPQEGHPKILCTEHLGRR
jgi:hypothetical protein